MIGDRIIIWTSPLAPFQQLYIYKDSEKVDQIGAQVNDLADILTTAIEKYKIYQLDFSGSHIFAQGLVRAFQQHYATKYSIDNITINYV